MQTFEKSKAISDKIWAEIEVSPNQFRMLTGDRPTGKLHLGHYFGTLKGRVELQNKGIETLILIADYQVITDRDSAGEIRENVYGLLADYLAAGIDPAKTIIFTHSAIPELNQLLLPFLSLVTEGELSRNPTVKAEHEASGRKSLSGLLLTYPVHQAADILFCKANIVPVGKDQLPHVELTRLIARRFNEKYAKVFPEPFGLLSETPEILGLDGRKMSKSYNNSIELSMTADETKKRILKAVTDAERVITYDPVNRPNVATLLTLASLATGKTPSEIADEIGDAGGFQLKTVTYAAINDYFAAHRAKRAELIANKDYLHSVLANGNERARAIATQTLDEVRSSMGMVY
ncbi:MAG: tryptophan--tRNA ligase [Bifidobacteriaceae bacterium]|jgi:tryptophanyl-tRNA synthetase|nr:tryptophan--tRNA ligase [Bifidobacteriaceae bacterium]